MTTLHVCMTGCLMITGCESINGNDRTTFFLCLWTQRRTIAKLMSWWHVSAVCDRQANEQQSDMKAMGPKDAAWQFVLF